MASREKTIGDRIREKRKELGLTQEMLGDRIKELTGNPRFARMNPSKWERGSSKPERENLAALAEVLGVTEAWIEYGHDRGAVVYDPIEDESRPLVDHLLAARRDFSAAKKAWIRARLEETNRLEGDDPDRVWDDIKSQAAVYEYETGRKLPLPERERVEEPKVKGESIRDAVLGKKPKR